MWQESAGQWFELRSYPVLPADQLAGFAGSLVPAPVTAPAPFTFAVVPDGYAVDNISPAAVRFCPPGGAFDESFAGKITVMLGAAGEQSKGRGVDVGERPRAPLPETDLIRFAAGITVTPAATVGQGRPIVPDPGEDWGGSQ